MLHSQIDLRVHNPPEKADYTWRINSIRYKETPKEDFFRFTFHLMKFLIIMTLIYGFNKYKRIIKCLLISLKYKVIQCLSVSPLSVKYADHNLLIYSPQLHISLSFLVFHTYGATKYNWIRASNTYYHSITLTADLLKLNPLCEVAGRSVNQSVSQSLSLSPPTTNLPPNELKECPHLQPKPSALGN